MSTLSVIELNKSKCIVDIHGEPLGRDLKPFSENLSDKRKLYFELALTHNLENIRYENLSLKSGDIMEEILPFQADDMEEVC